MVAARAGYSAVDVSVPAVAKWLGAFVVAEWMLLPNALQTLLIFMAIDYGSGLTAALMRREASSAVGFRGLMKKILTLVLLLTAHLLERRMGVELRIEHVGALGYTANEVISIVENLARAGVPIDSRLVEGLMTVKKLWSGRATEEQIRDLGKD